MSNTITIDLDSLSEERAQKLAGFILTYAGIEEEQVDEDMPTFIPEPIKRTIPPPEPSASEVFAPSAISAAGPQLIIPNPPTQPASIVMTTPPSQAATAEPSILPASANVNVTTLHSQETAPVAAVGTVSGVIVDSTGLPWDARIHSSAKTFNADGSWRARKGLPKDYVPRIEAELRQVMAIPGPTPIQTVVAPPATVTIPSPPPPTPPAPSADIQPYLALMNKVSSALANARITQPQLQKVCEAVGLPHFASLGTRLDLVAQVAPMIDGILAGSAV